MTFVLMVLFLVVETVLPFEGLGLGLVKVVCLTTTFLVGFTVLVTISTDVGLTVCGIILNIRKGLVNCILL